MDRRWTRPNLLMFVGPAIYMPSTEPALARIPNQRVGIYSRDVGKFPHGWVWPQPSQGTFSRHAYCLLPLGGGNWP
jgi:hypothetical protein